MHLLLAPFLASVILVETRQIAVVALVQRQVLPHGKAGLAEFGQGQIERVLRALEHRGESDIERKPLRLQLAASFPCLRDPLCSKIRLLPAGEKVLPIPFALAMTHQPETTVAHLLSPFRSLDIAQSKVR